VDGSTPEPERVRLHLWAIRQAESEVDWDFDYSAEQRQRIVRNVKDRARWLMIVGQRPRPVLSEAVALVHPHLRVASADGAAKMSA
jgi:hypothetical protein